MLLRWSLGQDGAATMIESAVARALDDGFRTGDLMLGGGNPGARLVGTAGMTAAVIDRISTLAGALG
jgi:isocitrate/isopropylmalate dehydrogenase